MLLLAFQYGREGRERDIESFNTIYYTHRWNFEFPMLLQVGPTALLVKLSDLLTASRYNLDGKYPTRRLQDRETVHTLRVSV